MALLIEDGYTLEAKIPVKGRTPEVTFRYRPALPETIYQYLAEPKSNGKDAMKAHSKLLIDHLVSWDVRDAKEETVPITPETLKKVPYKVLEQIINFVTGYGPEEQIFDVKN